MNSLASTRFPAFFISHGGPPLAVDGGPTYRFLKDLGRRLLLLKKPKVIVMVSAHYISRDSTVRVTSDARMRTIYDFGGFDEVRHLKYPAPGSPATAQTVVELLNKGGVPARLESNRGLDHGAWVPLVLMFPNCDIPVIQISMLASFDPAAHIAMGKALAPLKQDPDVLFLASGSLTHNFSVFQWMHGGGPKGWRETMSRFEKMMGQIMAKQGAEREKELLQLVDTPECDMAHPQIDHLLPAYVVAGYEFDKPASVVHEGKAVGFDMCLNAYEFRI
mmetsp:Transcript_28810/g.46614  ORF Transcript_28810/g.46614 Transcript_28810/m.46614 type:complete len:276 (+) Transcript_28810:153-980(+)|eukprot:CAMPEP_0184671672 /NCGR_PEP_ID=MMETSP0308-20130426/85640_1 /TAXON_ID=38269 /ORGANISM="Gloeochaete witrockiana, Strain SAG 46.84" /LENGTH=275 /DNA_ID=CAMNT_0027118843 /DNA_START=69 /DNA_END=896 /DNA_ORIENTATION=-